MLLYNTDSWHYLLVLYVFGKNFFTQRDTINLEASEKNNAIIWSRKPRVVNFCPYCRAVLWGVITILFVWLWRKLPHKQKKELSHQEIMKRMNRRSIIIRILAGGLNIVLGVQKIISFEEFIVADFVVGIFQIVMGIIIIFMKSIFEFLKPGIKFIVKFITKYWPEKKPKPKQEKPVKSPSLIKTYFTENHDKFCPPIAFVNPNDTEIRR